MFYIIAHSYGTGSAGMNRILGYLKTLSANEIETTIVFVYPDSKRSTMEGVLPHVSVRYLWKEYYYSQKKVVEVFLRKIYPLRFKRCLKQGDKVFVYSEGEFQHYIMGVSGVKYFHEKTEHPLAIGKGNPITGFSLKKYFNDCKRLDGLFVISTCLRDFFVSEGVERSKIHIINMTVDTSRFSGVVKQETEKYIAYCGIIFNNKDGVDLLIKSFALVHSSHPEVKLYIIGPIPEKTDNNLIIKMIDDLDVSDSVVLTGNITSERMPQLLKNAEICALNRPDGLRAKAGFPTKLGEYLLSENPVVVSSVGDIPLFLEDGVSALLSIPNDIKSFADKLEWALSNSEQAAKIGKKGSEVARQYFNAITETNKIIEVVFPN